MRPYEIVLKSGAIDDLDGLRKYDATQIADAMEKYGRGRKQTAAQAAGRRAVDYRL